MASNKCYPLNQKQYSTVQVGLKLFNAIHCYAVHGVLKARILK